MSAPSAMASSQPPQDGAPPARKLSAQDAELLRNLDATVDRISKALPAAPFILSVPCTEPQYQQWYREELESFCRNVPFEMHEARLQYQSFIYRDPVDSCYVSRSEVDEERDRRKANGLPSSSSTPVPSSGPKKKITLADYKSKQAAGNGTAPASAKPTEPKKDNPSVNGTAPPTDSGKHAVQAPQKRPLDAPDAASNHISSQGAVQPTVTAPTPPAAKPDPSPPAKKLRLSPSPALKPSPFLVPASARKSLPPKPHRPEERPSNTNLKAVIDQHTSPPAGKPTIVTKNGSNSTPHGLPPLLSPTILPEPPHGLPPMLSPTLPNNIETELAKVGHKKSNSQSSSSSDKKLQPAPKISPQVRPITHADHARRKSLNQEQPQKGIAQVVPKKKPATKSNDLGSSPHVDAQRVDGKKPIKSTAEKSIATSHTSSKAGPSEPSLIVKLPYGKTHREDVKQIIKKSAAKPRQLESAVETRKGDPVAKLKESSTKDASRKTAAATPAATKPSAEKRRLEEDGSTGGPAKRQKVPSTLDLDKNPRTPVQPPKISPALSNRSSAQKSQQHLTPRKDIRALVMSRTASADSNEMSTPQAPAGTPEASRGTTSAPATSFNEGAQWGTTSQRYNEQGRQIKRQVQEHFDKIQSGEASDDEKKLAAVKSIECLLCYLLAYSANETSRRLRYNSAPEITSINNTWFTLSGIFTLFHNATRPFPHLDGLRYYLGAVISRHIVSILGTGRIDSSGSTANGGSRAAPPQSSGGSSPPHIPTSSAAEATTINLDPRRLQAAFRHMAQYAHDARILLPFDALVESYPLTWADRSRNAPPAPLEHDRLAAPGVWGTEYWLPIGEDTTPVQAVRFAVRFLEEWKGKEDVEGEGLVRL